MLQLHQFADLMTLFIHITRQHLIAYKVWLQLNLHNLHCNTLIIFQIPDLIIEKSNLIQLIRWRYMYHTNKRNINQTQVRKVCMSSENSSSEPQKPLNLRMLDSKLKTLWNAPSTWQSNSEHLLLKTKTAENLCKSQESSWILNYIATTKQNKIL